MKKESFKILFEKYLDGKTTLKEERTLKTLYASGEVPEEYLPFKGYFNHLQKDAHQQSGEDPFAKISEEDAPVVPLRSRRTIILRVAGIAASIIIVIGLLFQLERLINTVDEKYRDPEVAYQDARTVLLFVSSKLNTGTEKLKPIDKVNESVEQLQQVSKFNEGIQQSQKVSKYNTLNRIIGTSN
jgi:hypothetical protein